MDDPGPSAAYIRSFPATADGPIRPLDSSEPLLPPDEDPMVEGQAESLYALLNLPSSASDAEIRERYRSLATTFHPDRQRSDDARRAAHSRFTEIQRAYEVLTDPTKRTVYDLFGEEGLRTSWEVGPRNRTPEEMRAHFQRQAYEKKQLDAEALVKPKGDMSVVLDARAVFLPPSFFNNASRMSHTPIARLGRVRPGQILMKHSFETPLNKTTQIVWTGQMVARSGAGGGNVVGTVKHQFSSKCWGEFSRTENHHGERHLHDRRAHCVPFPPPLCFSCTYRFSFLPLTIPALKTGFWSLGPWGASLPLTHPSRRDRSALAIGLTNSRPNGSGWTVETQAGIIANHISADWSTRLLGVRVKIGAALGTDSGINAFVDGEGKVTASARVGCVVQADLGGGVTMRWRFSRLGQSISVPILLSHNLNPYVVLCSTVIPAASYAALYHLYLLPRKRRRIAERVRELRHEHADYIAQKRAEAHEAILLLERPTAQRVAAEREKDGLIIISAHYGRATNFSDRGIRLGCGVGTGVNENGRIPVPLSHPAEHGEESHPEEEEVVVDVTVPVQALVQDSRLYIPGGRAKDPCIGENKKLRVRYLFRNRMHQVTVDDIAALRAPLKAHALDE
ncbi:hypothetical protein JCM24511_07498 [Saitozyma sp. JCM 24511]|nr:hypothetical protein JCM24511_07498 [Saitozyma sp. JCM 24511]